MPSVTDAPAAFLAFGGEAATVSRTGYITAFARSLSRRSDPPEIANDDHLADVFLLPVYRVLGRAPRLARRLFDRAVPGGVEKDAPVHAQGCRHPTDGCTHA